MTSFLKKSIKIVLSKTSSEFARLFYLADLKKKEEKNFLDLFINFKNESEKHTKRFKLDSEDSFPCMNDSTSVTTFDTHYIYHPAWAARIVKELNPTFHTDISSTLHFCSILSAYIPVKFYDYRPAKLNLSGLNSESADLTQLHFPDNSVQSLSCMHTIEHIGLGRYGDPVDYDGDIKAANELKRVLAKNGTLLIVVPVGKPKIMFNAHRIYGYSQIIELFSGLKLEEFTLIPDNALETGIINFASIELADKQNYGCGCFRFKKV